MKLQIVSVLLASCFALPAIVPVSDEDIVATNNALATVLVKANADLPVLIKDKGLDPIASSISQGKTQTGTPINLFFCNATASAEYELKNLVGLSSLRVELLRALSGEVEDVSGILKFALSGNTAPVDLSIDLIGQFIAAASISLRYSVAIYI